MKLPSNRSTGKRANFQKVSTFTLFGMKLTINFLKPDNHFWLWNDFILNLQARNKENIVPAILRRTASRIKHSHTNRLLFSIE